MSSVDWSSSLVFTEAMIKCCGINEMAMINEEQLSKLMVACYHGNPDYVKTILETPGIRIDLQNDEGRHALMCACELGHTQVAQMLLTVCPQVLNLAMKAGDTSLMAASRRGHLELVSLLLQKGAGINTQDGDGWSPLMMASNSGHAAIVSKLLHNGACVNMQESEGQFPLMLASNLDIVSLLLQNSADVNMQDDDGMSSLMNASQDGQIEIVSMLLNNFADVDHCDRYGWSSLMAACKNGHTEIVSLLIENKAYVNMQNNDGRSALMLAYVNMQNNDGRSALMLASQSGHTGIILLLLKAGADINMQDNYGSSSLIIASQCGQTNTVSLLLQNGAEVNMQNKAGWSSLMMASQCGHQETVLKLIQSNSNVNVQANDGWTPLMVASYHGYWEIVSILLQNYAHVNALTKNGWSALMLASESGQEDTVSLLFQFGADINLSGMKVMPSLLTQGFESSFTKRVNITALMAAVKMQRTAIAHELLDKGADVTVVNLQGESVLTIAVRFNLTSVVEEIIKNTEHSVLSDILEHQNDYGKSSLMIASIHGHIKIAKTLLKAGAKVQTASFQNWQIKFPFEITTMNGSALDIAVVQGNDEMVSLLLEYNAEISNISYLIGSIILKTSQEKFGNSPSDIILHVKQALGIDSDGSIQEPNFIITTTDLERSSFWDNFQVVLTQLISHDTNLINQIHSAQPSTLYMACAFGVLVMAEVLLGVGVELCDLYRIEHDLSLSYWSLLITIIGNRSHFKPKTLLTGVLCQVDWLKYKTILTLLLDQGLDPNHQDDNELGSFALNIASGLGHSDLVDLLLMYGANVNLQDNHKVSSLIAACKEGHVDVSKTLLSHEAKVDLQDKNGWSALMFAVERGHADLISQLLQNKAQVNLQDSTGTTPLLLSCKFGRVPVIKTLLHHNADVNLQNNEGVSALMLMDLVLKPLDTHPVNLSAYSNKKRTSSSMDDASELKDQMERIVQNFQKCVADAQAIIGDLASPAAKQIRNEDKLDSKPSNLSEVCDRLYYAGHDWENVGRRLGLCDDSLKIIKHDCNSADNCLQGVLCKWWKRINPVPTWRELHDALAQPTTNQIIAQKIMADYGP